MESISSLNFPRIQPLGDKGFLLTFGDTIDEKGFHTVRRALYALTHPPIEGMTETIPGYATLLLYYDPEKISYERLSEITLSRFSETATIKLPLPRTVMIPVCYGGKFGPDIDFVAKSHNLTVEEVIKFHTSGRYPVYMLGFTPGFPYLGGLSEKLWTPRLETPRTLVPAGSVGIANNQTGIYPVGSPGGWRIIGRTPLKLFDTERVDPFLIHPGEIVLFRSISSEEYQNIERGGSHG